MRDCLLFRRLLLPESTVCTFRNAKNRTISGNSYYTGDRNKWNRTKRGSPAPLNLFGRSAQICPNQPIYHWKIPHRVSVVLVFVQTNRRTNHASGLWRQTDMAGYGCRLGWSNLTYITLISIMKDWEGWISKAEVFHFDIVQKIWLEKLQFGTWTTKCYPEH